MFVTPLPEGLIGRTARSALNGATSPIRFHVHRLPLRDARNEGSDAPIRQAEFAFPAADSSAAGGLLSCHRNTPTLYPFLKSSYEAIHPAMIVRISSDILRTLFVPLK